MLTSYRSNVYSLPYNTCNCSPFVHSGGKSNIEIKIGITISGFIYGSPKVKMGDSTRNQFKNKENNLKCVCAFVSSQCAGWRKM